MGQELPDDGRVGCAEHLGPGWQVNHKKTQQLWREEGLGGALAPERQTPGLLDWIVETRGPHAATRGLPPSPSVRSFDRSRCLVVQRASHLEAPGSR
jgi:hypothetical protein